MPGVKRGVFALAAVVMLSSPLYAQATLSGVAKDTSGVVLPGVTVSNGFGPQQDVGGALGPTTLALMSHGSRVSDQRLLVNGVALSTMIGGGWGGGAVPNATGTSEFAIDTGAVDATSA